MLVRFHLVEGTDDPAVDSARRLFEEYQRELGVDLCFQGFAEELANLPGKYATPRGRLYLVYFGEVPIGCAGLRPLDGESTDQFRACEIKRMYVHPEFRGEGFGKELLALLLKAAEMEGYSEVRLDTLRRLSTAIALYQRYGFSEIPAYNANPEDDVVYMARRVQ